MTYRILPAEEWPRLADILGDKIEFLPHPQSAICSVAESEDGDIQGCLFMQIALHMEPLVLKTPFASFLRLSETLEEHLANQKGVPYYTFSDSTIVEGMAEKNGMERTPYTGVWRKEI